MDKATQELRRRMKAERTPKGQLSPFKSRGMGRRNKVERFPRKECSHVDITAASKVIWLRRERPDGTSYSIRLVKNGRPCHKAWDVVIDGKAYCREHVPHNDYEPVKSGSPRSGMTPIG